jgi:hypothetical protein
MAILRESLLSLSRLVPYVRQGASGWLTNGGPARLKQLERDVRSLSAYETRPRRTDLKLCEPSLHSPGLSPVLGRVA